MKLLLDENVPESIMKELKKVGHDAEHINRNCKGKSDSEVLEYALKQKRCIVSLDSDFCGFKRKKHFGIIKISGKSEKPCEALLEVLRLHKGSNLEDTYIQINEKDAFKEVKKYGKKHRLRFKQFQRIKLNLECFTN